MLQPVVLYYSFWGTIFRSDEDPKILIKALEKAGKWTVKWIPRAGMNLHAVSPSDCRTPVEASQEDEETDPSRDDDSSAFRARSDSAGPFTALRWAARRFAMQCVCRIIAQCETADPAHFDMALAQERRLHESTGKTLPHPQ